jgi:hypothetical protein
MRKIRIAAIPFVLLLLVAVALPLSAADSGTWTGEVLDLACYIANGAHGAGHADCAGTCLKAGQPMGLLTDDGEVLLLAASHDDGAPYQKLKGLAGKKAEVTGTLAEKAGMKMVTVTGSSAAM